MDVVEAICYLILIGERIVGTIETVKMQMFSATMSSNKDLNKIKEFFYDLSFHISGDSNYWSKELQ